LTSSGCFEQRLVAAGSRQDFAGGGCPPLIGTHLIETHGFWMKQQ
jgi:hypothetical protein